MMNQKVLRRLCLTGFLAGTVVMAGCSGDDGADGVGFVMDDNVKAGVSACLTCHAATVGAEHIESRHVIHSTHISRADEASCLECHDPLKEGWRLEAYVEDKSNIPAGGLAAVTCEACHGASSNHANLPLTYKPEFVKPDSAKCGECHSTLLASHIPHHPFADEIADRFATSRHANQRARIGLCAACHSHEGFVEFPSRTRRGDKAQLSEAFAATDAYALAETEVSTKQCATCHDSHATGLRGDGDITDENGAVIFSAEFNLCTACHMVNLDYEVAGHGDEGDLYSYQLSDQYLSENMWDAELGTFDYTKTVFYHDGTSANSRVFVDTHFGGTIAQRIVEVDDSTLGDDVVLKGYNINAGSHNACTICHDPHTAGKMLSVAEGQADDPDNAAVSYAEGLGDFHTNYLGGAMGHGCAPCHNANEFVKVTAGASLASVSSVRVTAPIGCRTCHDLAVANAEPAVNNAESFDDVREFPADYEFAFNSGVVVTDDLGNNRVCFECHKGRTAGLTEAAYDDQAAANTYTVKVGGVDTTYTGTQGYQISYLHYAPVFAILYGSESEMVSTYPGKTYAGRFTHGGGAINGVTEFGCVDCHNVHDTNGNNAVTSKMTTSSDCKGCHEAGGFADAANLQARTQAFSEALLAAILGAMNDAYDSGAITTANGYQSSLVDILDTLFNTGLTAAEQEDALMTYIQGRTVGFPTAAIAKAATAWKVFTYEDGAPHGQTHGHGGSWAHNSKFARQVMFDAIEDLGGDTTDLTRP